MVRQLCSAPLAPLEKSNVSRDSLHRDGSNAIPHPEGRNYWDLCAFGEKFGRNPFESFRHDSPMTSISALPQKRSRVPAIREIVSRDKGEETQSGQRLAEDEADSHSPDHFCPTSRRGRK